MITLYPSVLSSAKRLPQKLLPKKLAAAYAGRGMLIAIDANVPHGNILANSAIRGAEILRLDITQDSIWQITQAVHRNCPNSIHLVVHGSPGCLHFSSGDLTLSNLPHYAEQLESWFGYAPCHWGSSMKVKAARSFLSLHACNVAAEAAGAAFLEHLQYLVGVRIHASQSNVGSITLQDSWALEVSHPFPQEAVLPFTQKVMARNAIARNIK